MRNALSGVNHRTRMRRPILTPLRAFLLSSLPALLCLLILPMTGASLDRTIGIAGAVFAIGAFGIQQVQARLIPERRVIFLAKSRSNFASNILRGVREQLADIPAISVLASNPPAGADDVVRWQIEQLGSPAVRSAHGLVIIPAGDDIELWHALAGALRQGIFVVCIDTKPANQLFSQLGLPRPAFVGSDFAQGGDTAGQLIADALTAEPSARAIIALGPDKSWPAKERASWILYRIAMHGHAHRCTHVMLGDWDEAAAVATLMPAIRADLDKHTGPLIVFCANDKIARALWVTMGRELLVPDRERVRMIGYDGTTSEDGSLVLASMNGVHATVDTLPFQQGRVAGELLNEAFDGETSPAMTRYIRPRVVVFEPLLGLPGATQEAASRHDTVS